MLRRRNYSVDNKISNVDFWLKKVEWAYIFNSMPFQNHIKIQHNIKCFIKKVETRREREWENNDSIKMWKLDGRRTTAKWLSKSKQVES